MGVDQRTTSRIQAALSRWQKTKAVRGCLGATPGEPCSAKPCNNHTIQNGAVLDLLQRDGHVYMLDWVNNQVGVVFQRIGRHRASTFSGYCGPHDTQVFRNIDFRDMSQLDPQCPRQQVLFALRAFAREYWAKLNNSAIMWEIVNQARQGDEVSMSTALGISVEDAAQLCARVDDMIVPALMGTDRAIPEIGHRFESLRTQLRTQSWHQSVVRSWSFQSQPTIAASAVFTPDTDFQGNSIAELWKSEQAAHVALTVIPQESRTDVMLLYHRRARHGIDKMVRQLDGMPQREREVAVSRLLIAHCENVAYSPALVETLSEADTRLITTSYAATLADRIPYADLPDLSLFRR